MVVVGVRRCIAFCFLDVGRGFRWRVERGCVLEGSLNWVRSQEMVN